MRSRVLPVVLWLSLAASATAVGLATVSAVREVVADDPVRVLSAGDVENLLHEPSADLDPIATLTASDSVPAGLGRIDEEGSQVDSREAMAHADDDRTQVPTNADDRPSRLGSDPGTLAGTRGGPARTTRDAAVTSDELEQAGGNPRAQPTPSPTPSSTSSASPMPSPTPSATESPAGTPEPSASPSGTASPSPSPSSPPPSPSEWPVSSPSPSTTSTGPWQSPTPAVSSPTAGPPGSATPPPPRLVVRAASSTGWRLVPAGW